MINIKTLRRSFPFILITKTSNQEFRKYLAISNGSSFEVKAQIYLALELEYISESEAEDLLRMCEEISRLIGALRKKMN